MSKLSQQLENARTDYEKRKRAVQRIEHHLDRLTLSENDDDHEAATVALRIARAEALDSEHQVNALVAKYREDTFTHRNVSVLDTTVSVNETNERDHFSEALDRVDPQLRLQLAK